MPTLDGFTANTADALLLGPGALYKDLFLPTQRKLGATRGGSTFNPGVTTRNIEVDSLYEMQKGLTLVENIKPMIQTNLLELTYQNLLLTIPGAKEGVLPGDSFDFVQEETLAAGDGATTVFPLANVDASEACIFYWDATNGYVQQGGFTVLNVGDTGHSGGATAEIVFDVAPVAGADIRVSYRFLKGDTTGYRSIVSGAIDNDSYFKNIALMTTVNNQFNADGTAKRAIFIINNAIAETTQDLGFQNKNEAVQQVTFYASRDICAEEKLYEILYPETVSTALC